MSIQEMKSQIHHMVDEIKDEAILQEVSRILSGSSTADVLDALTEEQMTGLENARQEAQNGQGMSLADFKRKMEQKWPQLKSL